MFKLLEGFEGVLERPVIAHELHANHLRLLSLYAADLGAVRSLLILTPSFVCAPFPKGFLSLPYKIANHLVSVDYSGQGDQPNAEEIAVSGLPNLRGCHPVPNFGCRS